MNLAKCVFCKPEIEFLGHHISKAGIAPVADKVEAIRQFAQPTTFKQLQEFLGMLNFYHRFIPKAADILRPLHALSKGKSQDITWTDETQRAFVDSKEALAQASLLTYQDSKAPLALTTDASAFAVGGVV